MAVNHIGDRTDQESTMTISREPGSRTVLISGASKGIGRSLAERLAVQGDTVVGIARTPDATFPGLLYTADVSDRTATSVALQEISSAHRIDAVVNNVGLVRPQSLEDVTLDALDAVLDVNLRTAIQLAQAVLPAMRRQGWGRVVNVASLVALGAPQKRTAYAAAKAALISATRVWALELAATGITVNAVAPGPVETELFRENNPPGSFDIQHHLRANPPNDVKRDVIPVALTCTDPSDSATVHTPTRCTGCGRLIKDDGSVQAARVRRHQPGRTSTQQIPSESDDARIRPFQRS
jgi:3-oxoacyl-[acyl-carrier protein] reductase